MNIKQTQPYRGMKLENERRLNSNNDMDATLLFANIGNSPFAQLSQKELDDELDHLMRFRFRQNYKKDIDKLLGKYLKEIDKMEKNK